MKNSYESIVLGLYTGIFSDARVALPTVVGLGRCESRLSFTTQTRGMSFLTIDMPAFGKHFDKCLSQGYLTASGVPGFGVPKGGVVPRFLGGLLRSVFDENGVLLSQPSHTAIFFIRQLCYAAKKIKVDCKDDIREQCLQNYVNLEQQLRNYSLNWHDLRLDARSSCGLHLYDEGRAVGQQELYPAEVSKQLCDTVHEVADRIFTSFGIFDSRGEWRPKHGPGAIADGPGDTYKYDFPTWSARLEQSFPYADLAHANYMVWARRAKEGLVPHEKEVPCVALTVPKSQKGPRIIAKEPAAAMWCQQMIRDFLETKVSEGPLSKCIAFRDQRHNQAAALAASVNEDAWTVDLKDASDRLTLWLVERLVRKNHSLMQALHSSRSQYCEVPLREGTTILRMKKFAPQGSATTFPLQTIVYAILAISAVIYAQGQRVSAKTIRGAARQVRVFGDDTVVPDFAGAHYVSILTYCGFLVNPDKTFGTGKFRESCGYEAYDGTDVTPAYITQPYDESMPSSIASTVECSNNFYKKGLWHAAASLESTLPRYVLKALRVVHVDEGAFGLSSYVGTSEDHLRRSYNGILHREEVLAYVINSRMSKTEVEGYGPLLQYFTEQPAQDIHWTSGLVGRVSARAVRRWEPSLK